jgi:hypothetical protein
MQDQLRDGLNADGRCDRYQFRQYLLIGPKGSIEFRPGALTAFAPVIDAAGGCLPHGEGRLHGKLDAFVTGAGFARGFDLKFRAGLAPGGNGGPERDQYLDLGIDDWFA